MLETLETTTAADPALAEVLADEGLRAAAVASGDYWTQISLWHGCLRKRRHDTEAEAWAQTNDPPPEVRPYQCPHGTHWHLGRDGVSTQYATRQLWRHHRNITKTLKNQRRDGTIQLRGWRIPVEVAETILPVLASRADGTSWKN